ncbi:MAG TPA: translation elongation factor Ts [Anaerolineae bacterium]|nr:translation elongation factor Ts [Anaerolineae bacterium]HPL28427.1 translation elongation factor Ts [Anaerolineae bacterium]
MAITTEMIKDLRERTGAGVLDCRKALQQAAGSLDKALAILREQGLATAAKKAARVAREGLIEAYIHPGAKVAALLEIDCETDFVARTAEFRALAHDLAMQIAATKPLYVSKEDVPAEVIEAKRALYLAEIAEENKPDHVKASIIEGKLAKFFQEACLLEQPFIKEETTRVRDLITQHIAKLGENIVVRRFARFAIGEE